MTDAPCYLFRFRDLLTKDTLDAHRRIIAEHGYCWWGWWRRPAEADHRRVWEELNELTQGGAEVKILLFNSDPEKPSESAIYRATVTGIVPPSGGGDGGNYTVPALPEGEEAKVPEYYRNAPFSLAWLRLTAIDEKPVTEFFRKYSFANAPKLPGLSERDCERYENKRILDGDELRAMDTTVWQIRKSRGKDSKDRILATSVKVSEAHSAQPIALRSARILHLSDLHFASRNFSQQHNWDWLGDGPNTLHAKIHSCLSSLPKELEIRVGLVIISGDLTHRADHGEFYEAFRFVHALLGALGLGSEHLVVVPGNHDLEWTKYSSEQWDPEEAVTETPEQAKIAYRKFYERVFRHPAGTHLGMARRFVCPNGMTLEVGGLNSSGLEQGENWLCGMGRLQNGAFEAVKETLGWKEDPSLALRILVHHHHLTVTEDVLPATEHSHGYGMAADAKKTLRQAARCGVQLVLHGHRHQPFIGAEQVYAELENAEKQWSLGHVAFIGGGSAGSTAVRGGANFFNVLDVSPQELDLRMFRAISQDGNQGDFREIHHWTSAIRHGVRGLELDHWKRQDQDRS